MQKQPDRSPHSHEAEKAVLGAILRDQSEFTNIIANAGLKQEQFFNNAHRLIFSIFVDLDADNEAIDIITVANKLRMNKEIETIGPEYLIDLTESCPISQNIPAYAEIIRDKFFLRKIITACIDTANQAGRTEGDIKCFVENIEKAFLEISNEQDTEGGLITGKKALETALLDLEKRLNQDGTLTGVASGFNELDLVTGGWQKSDLVILAARPAMGKTALALNLLVNAVKSGKTAVIFTLEMSKEQLIDRLIAAEGRINSSKLRRGDLEEHEQNRLMHAARTIAKYSSRLAIDETPSITISELRSRCRRYKKEHGLDLILVDYLQLMGSATKGNSREREVAEISAGLKGIAKELSVAVIALSQLNRGSDSRPDKRPKISDLRESGSIEQDADMIMFVYRDEYYDPGSAATGQAELIIGKNRHGETPTINLAFISQFVSFHNLKHDA